MTGPLEEESQTTHTFIIQDAQMLSPIRDGPVTISAPPFQVTVAFFSRRHGGDRAFDLGDRRTCRAVARCWLRTQVYLVKQGSRAPVVDASDAAPRSPHIEHGVFACGLKRRHLMSLLIGLLCCCLAPL
jgi:hypothetical protein